MKGRPPLGGLGGFGWGLVLSFALAAVGLWLGRAALLPADGMPVQVAVALLALALIWLGFGVLASRPHRDASAPDGSGLAGWLDRLGPWRLVLILLLVAGSAGSYIWRADIAQLDPVL